jgi:dolichyl-phosphate-mannose-protein mannosyltransferase
MLGLSVGLAQLFKYNGWIAGVLVALSAAIWFLFRRDERTHKTLVATWGWGLLAALVAASVYWPWFRFVESHGGYAALLAHQRSYLGGFWAWWIHLHVQVSQALVDLSQRLDCRLCSTVYDGRFQDREAFLPGSPRGGG